MVIQSTMTVSGIVEVWAETREIFKKHGIQISEEQLGRATTQIEMESLLEELNRAVGSSKATCTEGG